MDNLHQDNDNYSTGILILEEQMAINIKAFSEFYKVFIVDVCSDFTVLAATGEQRA